MRLVVPILALAAIAFAGALGFSLGMRTGTPADRPLPVVARGDLSEAEEAIIELFEAARDSVVFIATREELRDPWRRRRTEVPRGSGSGFIWDDAGHIVTNAHVIAGASSATVRLADGRAWEASLVGVDQSHDLAVLRIDAPPSALSPLPIGRSSNLKVGQKVLAIGNPFGLDFTLTTGIVSALERELQGEGGNVIRGLIQTDAAINPGNSGGPLLDSAGRLIGVNTAIYSPSGASAGIGFAVPVDAVNRVVPQLIARGEYRPPVLGIRADPRADALLARRGDLRGALVLGVEPGSPAAEAGLQPARMGRNGALIAGDIITAMDGRAVRGIEDLRAMLDRRSAGEEVTLRLNRDGESREVALTLAEG